MLKTLTSKIYKPQLFTPFKIILYIILGLLIVYFSPIILYIGEAFWEKFLIASIVKHTDIKNHLFLNPDNGPIISYDFNTSRNEIIYVTGEPYEKTNKRGGPVDIYIWDQKTSPTKIGNIQLYWNSPYYINLLSVGDNKYYVDGGSEIVEIQNKQITRRIPVYGIENFTQNGLPPTENTKAQMSSYCRDIVQKATQIQLLKTNQDSSGKFYGDYIFQIPNQTTFALSSDVCNNQLNLTNRQFNIMPLHNNGLFVDGKEYGGSSSSQGNGIDKQTGVEIYMNKFISNCIDECTYYYKIKFGGVSFKDNYPIFITHSGYLTNSEGKLVWLTDGKLYKF